MAASNFTAGTWPNKTSQRITVNALSDQRALVNMFNLLLTNLSTYFAKIQDDAVIVQGIPSTGTTNTMATAAQTIVVNGVPGAITAETAKAFGALGTIPASTWGIIAVERVLASTTTFVSGTANYTTGYATEALAIAALPAQSADKVQTGYITIKASASTWIAGTDGLAAGSGGNVATTTNFYAIPSVYDTTAWTVSQIADQSATVLTTTAGG